MELKRANELKKSASYEAAFNEACENVMKAIERNNDKGYCNVVFYPRAKTYPIYQNDSDPMYSAVKKKFIELGYTFEPLGYSGGVWQDGENICW